LPTFSCENYVQSGPATSPVRCKSLVIRNGSCFDECRGAESLRAYVQVSTLVPAQLPLGGSWSPDEILALNTLMEDCKGKYQICGPNAFNRYGFDEQVPTRVYAYNNRISGDRKIGSVALTLIEVGEGRLGDTEVVQTSEGAKAVYSSLARTLLDAVMIGRVSTLCASVRMDR